MITILDLKNYLDKLISEGKGDRIIWTEYENYVDKINDASDLFYECEENCTEIAGRDINKGDFLLIVG